MYACVEVSQPRGVLVGLGEQLVREPPDSYVAASSSIYIPLCFKLLRLVCSF